MFPAFVIHSPTHTDRNEIVEDIVNKTGATQFQSYLLSDPVRGCLASHVGVAKLAKSLYPESHYLVFEDDCELFENWNVPIQDASGFDVVYLGYTDKCSYATFGTHALLLSPKARDLIIDKILLWAPFTDKKNAYDQVLSLMCREEGLSVCMPKYEMRETFCKQKRGLKSTITGHIRT